jgi:microcystin-dependent protein
MAKTITQLPDATSVAVGDELIVQQGGVTKRATKTEVLNGIVNANIDAAAAIAYSKLATLTAGNVVLGNASNVATSTALTGDVTVSSSGVTTIASGAVTSAKMAAGVSIPAGAVMGFARSTAPTGWLACSGQEVVVADYGDLTTAIYVGDGSNTDTDLVYGFKTNGSGTRSTTGTHIKLPDLRGEFLRGWDNSRGIDSSRKNRSFQADEFKAHTHGLNGQSLNTSAAGLGGFASSIYSASTTSASTGGTETRPRNVTVLYCIKT